MILEKGKRYVTRAGLITSPLEEGSEINFPFRGYVSKVRRSWTREGYYYGSCDEHELDLMREHEHSVAKIFKDDSNKLPMHLLPPEACIEIVKGFAFGAKKYGPFAWLDNPIEWLRVSDALRRHHDKWLAGKDNDPESGLLEMAHAGCNVIMLLEYQLRQLGKDNRYKGGGK